LELGYVMTLMVTNQKSSIKNRKSFLRMVNPPRLTKLGAKWVEVTKRRAKGVWAA
jgi:hypothetical protein